MAVALHLHVLAGAHGAGLCHPAKIVAPEVDQHHVLGALLGVAAQLVGQSLVVGGGCPTGPGAGDRMGGHAVAHDLDEELGACAHHLERRRPGEEQVGARVDPAQGAVQADPIDGLAVVGCREVEALAAGQHDLDRLACGDRVLGLLDGADVLVATEAGVRLCEPGRHRLLAAAREGRGQLCRRRSGGPLERLEDGTLGDAVAALQVGGVGVEAGDRAELVGEVVEDDHEVGLDVARERDADRVALGRGDRRLEGGDGVVAEGADRAAREARHPVHRDDAAARHEGAQRGERVGGLLDRHREVGGVVGDADGAAGGARDAVLDLEEPARADAKE